MSSVRSLYRLLPEKSTTLLFAWRSVQAGIQRYLARQARLRPSSLVRSKVRRCIT
jgi:hypothetical protein